MERTDEERRLDHAERNELGYERRALLYLVPSKYYGGIHRYITRGVPPGGFLGAVFKNDLVRSVTSADDPAVIPNLIKFLYSYTAAGCYGSEENYKRWLAVGGFEGWRKINVAQYAWSTRLTAEGTSQAEREFFIGQAWNQGLEHRVLHGLNPEDAVEDLYTQLHASWLLTEMGRVTWKVRKDAQVNPSN